MSSRSQARKVSEFHSPLLSWATDKTLAGASVAPRCLGQHCKECLLLWPENNEFGDLWGIKDPLFGIAPEKNECLPPWSCPVGDGSRYICPVHTEEAEAKRDKETWLNDLESLGWGPTRSLASRLLSQSCSLHSSSHSSPATGIPGGQPTLSPIPSQCRFDHTLLCWFLQPRPTRPFRHWCSQVQSPHPCPFFQEQCNLESLISLVDHLVVSDIPLNLSGTIWALTTNV